MSTSTRFSLAQGRPRWLVCCAAAVAVVVAGTTWPAVAHADNKRLNNGVVSNVYTVQHQAGCTTNIRRNPQLQLAAQWHADDLLNDRTLDGDIGSDGSTEVDRAKAAGFQGRVAETVAINPALAISGIEVMNQWYYNPAYLAIMRDCTNSEIGVWSVNGIDRTVLVAVYGNPNAVPSAQTAPQPAAASELPQAQLDPLPDANSAAGQYMSTSAKGL